MDACRRCSAYAGLVRSLEAQATYLRAEIDAYKAMELVNHEAIATLASEREANAILTAEVEELRKRLGER